MFVALNAAGERVQVLSHAQAAQMQAQRLKVYCPLCQEPLRIRNGRQVPAHFAHRAQSECVASGGESAEHMAGKLLLQRVGECAGWHTELEVVVGDGSQRIDVLLMQGNRRVALEFQCSPLSQRRIAERTAGYQQLGFDVQWFLGSRYLNNTLAGERMKFATLHDDGLHLQYCDVPHQKLIVDTAVTLTRWRRTVIWPVASEPVDCGGAQSMRRRGEKLARRVRLERQGKVRQVQNYCYAHGYNLAGCPWVVHMNLPVRPGFDLPVDLLRVVWLITFAGKPVTSATNQAFWRDHVDPLQLPLVASRVYGGQFANEFLVLLVQQGYLRTTKTGWRWLRQPEWYSDIDQKLQQL